MRFFSLLFVRVFLAIRRFFFAILGKRKIYMCMRVWTGDVDVTELIRKFFQHFLRHKYRASSHTRQIPFFLWHHVWCGFCISFHCQRFGSRQKKSKWKKIHENIDQNTRIDNKILKNYCNRFTWNSKFCKWPKNFTVHLVSLFAHFLSFNAEIIQRKKFGELFYRMLLMWIFHKCKY